MTQKLLATRNSQLATTLLWLLAFICGLYFNNDWQLELFGIAIALCFVWACVRLWGMAGQGLVIPRSRTMMFVGLLWLLVGASVAWSDVPYISLMGFCFFSVLPITFFGFALNADIINMRKMAYVLAGIAAILSVWAMIQFFVLNDEYQGRAHHPLADPNALGALFNLALFPALGWMMAARRKKESTLALILSVLLVGGIMATGSRGTFFSALISMAVFLFLNRGMAGAHIKCLAIFAGGAVVLFLLTNYGLRPHENMVERVADTITLNMADVSSNRWNIWAGAWALIVDHWMLGTGIATFYLYYPEYRLPNEIVGATMAHSDPLQFWAEMGIIAPILFYGICVCMVLRTCRALRAITGVTRVVAVSGFCGLLAMSIHAHLSFNFYNLSLLFLAGFLTAVWFLATRLEIDKPARVFGFPENMAITTRGGLLILPFVLILYVFSAYVISEFLVNKARVHLFSGRMLEFGDQLNLAITTSFSGNYRAYLLAVNVPLGILQDAGKTMDTAKQKEFYDQAMFFITRAQAMNPRSSSAAYYRGYAQELVNASVIPQDTQKPEEFYQEALRLDPLHLGARQAWARREKDINTSAKIMKAGLPYQYVDPNAMGFYAQTMLVCVQAGDNECRADTTAKMATFKTRMADSYRRQGVLGTEDNLTDRAVIH